MLVRQININKAKAGSDNLCLMISKGEISNIYLVQEPYRLKNGNIPGLPKDFRIYGIGSSRAIIIAHSKAPLFFSSDLSSKDHTVCLYESEGIKKFFISSYLDITLPAISDDLTKIADYITDSNIPAIIGMDSNSHSTLWNCKETNARGRALENFIFQCNIEILNKGSDSTFVSSRYSTIIDLTLAIGSTNDVASWSVIKKYQFSDHRLIEIDILINNTFNEAFKISKTDWTLFQNLLQVNPITYNKWDINTIELETAQLLELLTSALKKSTYFTTIKSPWRNNKWWSESLFRLKTKVIKLAKKLHSQDSTDED